MLAGGQDVEASVVESIVVHDSPEPEALPRAAMVKYTAKYGEDRPGGYGQYYEVKKASPRPIASRKGRPLFR